MDTSVPLFLEMPKDPPSASDLIDKLVRFADFIENEIGDRVLKNHLLAINEVQIGQIILKAHDEQSIPTTPEMIVKIKESFKIVEKSFLGKTDFETNMLVYQSLVQSKINGVVN